MPHRSNPKLGRIAARVVQVIALALGLGALAVAVEAQWPVLPISAMIASAYPVSDVFGARADAAVARSDFPAAISASDSEIALAPKRIYPRLRRADILFRWQGPGSRQAIAALMDTYDLSALDYTYGRRRMLTAFDHWPALSVDERRRVLAETAVLYQHYGTRDDVNGLPAQVNNAAGRMSLSLYLNMLKRNPGPQ